MRIKLTAGDENGMFFEAAGQRGKRCELPQNRHPDAIEHLDGPKKLRTEATAVCLDAETVVTGLMDSPAALYGPLCNRQRGW